MVAYLACPYSDPDPNVKALRHTIVNRVAFDLIRQGILVYSPLTHNLPIDQQGIFGSWKDWKEFDHAMLARCNRLLILKLPGWEASKGVAAEIAYAKECGIPIEWMEYAEEKYQDLSPLPLPMKRLLDRMMAFYAERDWSQFHSPKNLAMNLGVEVGELMEHFRWLSEAQSYTPEKMQGVRDEIGDVFIVLLHLAHTLNIDPIQAAHEKLSKIAIKYPVDKCKGLSHKYTAYQTQDQIIV